MTDYDDHSDAPDDVVIDIDAFGAVVLDLRAVYDRPVSAAAAARHRELMDSVAIEPGSPDETAASVTQGPT